MITATADERDAAQSRYYLESNGFDAVGVLGGETALQRLRDGLRPCGVVTDVVMPWVDGWAFVDAMRADPELAAVPVVMCSGHPEHVSRALQHGVRAYLPKPVEPGAVAAAVVRYCRWVPDPTAGTCRVETQSARACGVAPRVRAG